MLACCDQQHTDTAPFLDGRSLLVEKLRFQKSITKFPTKKEPLGINFGSGSGAGFSNTTLDEKMTLEE